MSVAFDVVLPLLLLLVLPLVPPHVVLSVLLPLLSLAHHLKSLLLQLLRRKLPTSDKQQKLSE